MGTPTRNFLQPLLAYSLVPRHFRMILGEVNPPLSSIAAASEMALPLRPPPPVIRVCTSVRSFVSLILFVANLMPS